MVSIENFKAQVLKLYLKKIFYYQTRQKVQKIFHDASAKINLMNFSFQLVKFIFNKLRMHIAEL